MKLKRIDFNGLNTRQRENYNYHKVAAHLADYGFNCVRIADDDERRKTIDFIADHIDGTVLKVQLLSELGFAKKYMKKQIWIAFIDRDDGSFYLYPHDEVLAAFMERDVIADTKSWVADKWYTYPSVPKKHADLLAPYKI